MVKLQIESLKNKLNNLISDGANLTDVYDLSVQLDKLILQYYRDKQKQTELS